MAGFGDALGGFIGGGMASNAIHEGQQAVGLLGLAGQQKLDPFVDFGTGMLPSYATALHNIAAASDDSPSFGDFMKDFKTSAGAQYQMDKALGAADTSAAARGGLLSGANIRNREEIAQGITATDMAQQYAQTLAGNQQRFGQLQGSAGAYLGGVGVGTTAAGFATQLLGSQLNAQAQLAAADAKAQSGKGGGIGGMLGGMFGGGKS